MWRCQPLQVPPPVFPSGTGYRSREAALTASDALSLMRAPVLGLASGACVHRTHFTCANACTRAPCHAEAGAGGLVECLAPSVLGTGFATVAGDPASGPHPWRNPSLVRMPPLPVLAVLPCPLHVGSSGLAGEGRMGAEPHNVLLHPGDVWFGGATFRIDREVCLDPPKQLAPQHGCPRSPGQVCPVPVPSLSAVRRVPQEPRPHLCTFRSRRLAFPAGS